ncbi:MAG: C-terminal helicase domain-containing protein [Candidatus Aenigmarchaeota archaeon]|nr:C-terminal helicase domain-containing protein [Candidatus Aenigmarchaeota archaeon]
MFCGTRTATDFVTNYLQRAGIEAQAIHGGLKQQSRMNVLEGFHKGKIHTLVATDVAARGLDIKNVSHIFNFDVPKTPEEYTHRIGRTARIGKEGVAITLITRNDHEIFRKIVEWNKGIEKYKL